MSAYKFKPKGSGNKKETITTIDKKDFPELSTNNKPAEEPKGLNFLDKVKVVVAKDTAKAVVAAAAEVKQKDKADEGLATGNLGPCFTRYYQLVKERNERDRKRWTSRHLYSSDEEENAQEENSVVPDDDADSFDDWTDDEEDNGGDTYDPSEFDRHR